MKTSQKKYSMWNVKTKVMTIIIGPTGTMSKSFRKYLNHTTGKQEIKELEKTAPCYVGPCHHGMARPQVADGGTASSYGE
jgi:hypothetical protein